MEHAVEPLYKDTTEMSLIRAHYAWQHGPRRFDRVKGSQLANHGFFFIRALISLLYPNIASKYTDLPVFILNSEHKYWQNFKNTEKIEDFVHTIYMELIIK